jgi:hypothetical protein
MTNVMKAKNTHIRMMSLKAERRIRARAPPEQTNGRFPRLGARKLWHGGTDLSLSLKMI